MGSFGVFFGKLLPDFRVITFDVTDFVAELSGNLCCCDQRNLFFSKIADRDRSAFLSIFHVILHFGFSYHKNTRNSPSIFTVDGEF